jgi:manganese transport protein
VLPTQRLDVLIAMGAADLVSVTMLTIAAQLFFGSSVSADGLEEVHTGLAVVVGGAASAAFAVALLASGLAAAAVGAYAGQVVMAGFLRRRIPLFIRRLVTRGPGHRPAGLWCRPDQALVWSQVVLCFEIPFALVPWSGSPRGATSWATGSPTSYGDRRFSDRRAAHTPG